MGEQKHSEEYFGAFRDFWWNQDFLALCAARYRLAEVREALDAGCGVGHWGRLLLPLLAPDARLTGVDAESEWVAEAARRAAEAGIGARAAYRAGRAERLPFPDASFDLATCQTVLIHVADARAVLAEMLRVLKPGGLLLAVEPNHLAGGVVLDSLAAGRSPDEIADGVRFALTRLKGKTALGLGDGTVADRLPGLLAELGCADIRAHLSDKASPLVPPYDTPEQRALKAQYLDWAKRAAGPWDRDESRTHFLAGGGSAEAFDRHWARAMREAGEFASALERGTYHTAGAAVMYLVAARRT